MATRVLANLSHERTKRPRAINLLYKHLGACCSSNLSVLLLLSYEYLLLVIYPIFLKQQKCEQYWNNDLDKPYDAGRGFSVVTTGYRSFADYEVRDLTIRKVGICFTQ